MSSNSLEYLCAGFCEIAQVAHPELREQGDGFVAFSVTWRDVAVDVVTRPSTGVPHAFVLFDLGLPDAAKADPSTVLLALMHANFMSLNVNQPVFSCHPETNTAILQCAFPLLDSTPAGLHQLITEGVELALRWREDYFMPQRREP